MYDIQGITFDRFILLDFFESSSESQTLEVKGEWLRIDFTIFIPWEIMLYPHITEEIDR